MQELAPHANFAVAPRDVPVGLCIRWLFGGAGLFGWAFLTVGSVGAWVFLPNSDQGWLTMRGPKATVAGVVTDAEETQFSIGGSEHHRGTPVYRYEFTYSVNGESYNGVSFQTGSCGREPGQFVQVEYLQARPDRARVVGMRAAPMPPYLLWVLIFPLIGGGLAFYQWRSGLRTIALLRHGHVALGTRLSTHRTNVQINNQTVYRVRFSFQAETGQRHETEVRTLNPQALEDDAAELLLYDPVKPERAVAVDNLPGHVRTDEYGQICASGMGVWLFLLPPLLAIVVNGVAARLVLL